MTPLSDEEFAPGRRVRDPEGNDVDVTGQITGHGGSRFLVVQQPGSQFGALIEAGTVRDQWEARDPEEVEQEREQEAEKKDQPADSDSGVTDATGVTDAPSEDPSPSTDPSPGNQQARES